MKYYLYILQSQSKGIYYVGQTNDLDTRLESHNLADRNTFTSKHRPWKLVALFECGSTRAEAIAVERFVKRQKTKSFIERLIHAEQLTGPLAQLVRVPHLRD